MCTFIVFLRIINSKIIFFTPVFLIKLFVEYFLNQMLEIEWSLCFDSILIKKNGFEGSMKWISLIAN